MRTIIRAASAVALALGFGQALAAVPLPNQTLNVSFGCVDGGGSESTYEIWLYNDGADTSWGSAQAFAASRDLRGFTGHLATFSDATEETCVLNEAAALGLGTNEQLWIGLAKTDGGAVPPGDWAWIGEPGNTYENWAGGEPNNAGGNENHATIGRYGYDISDGLNDEDESRPSLVGFVVEYDVAATGPVVIEDDTISIPSANPQNNKITLPAGTGDGGTANVEVFLINDDCSLATPANGSRLVEYGSDGETIPVANYLCDEQWILIISELEDVDIIEGVVEAEFEAADFGLSADGCSLDQGLPLSDPLGVDLVTYLPESEQWGVPPDGGAYPRSAAWMQDRTIGCGSSRGRMKKNQFFGVGLNFYFEGQTFVGNQAWVLDSLIALTTDKLRWLDESVVDARDRGAIRWVPAGILRFKIDRAIHAMSTGNYDKARFWVKSFIWWQERSRYNSSVAASLDFNFDGEQNARSNNVLYLLEDFIIPYFP